MRLKIAAALALSMGLALAFGSGAGAKVDRAAACSPTPCVESWTVDGGSPPSGVNLTVQSAGGQVTVQMTGAGSGLQMFELNPPLSNNSLIHMVLNLGSVDPVVFATTGVIQDYSTGTSGSDHTASIDLKPASTSWKFNGCQVSSCGDQTTKADVDYTSMVLGAISNLTGQPADFVTAMKNSSISTNAQAMGFPTFNSTTNAVSFQLAAPHLKSNGTTPNTGFFKFFVPDAMIVKMGIADPTTVSQGSFSMTNSNGGTVNFSVTHVSSPVAGAKIESTQDFTYSSPTFTLTPTTSSGGGGGGGGGEKCTVPNVVGKKLPAAKQAIAKAKCQTGKIKQAYSNTVPKTVVISQTPSAGTKLSKGGKINLVVSRGKKKK